MCQLNLNLLASSEVHVFLTPTGMTINICMIIRRLIAIHSARRNDQTILWQLYTDTKLSEQQ